MHIAEQDVWFFDDEAENITPFVGLGMYNARQVSCASRDEHLPTGYCGATTEEIVQVACSQAEGTLFTPDAPCHTHA